ncbi:hypothetical protein L195_g034271, partial [Trifolium pratense]
DSAAAPASAAAPPNLHLYCAKKLLFVCFFMPVVTFALDISGPPQSMSLQPIQPGIEAARSYSLSICVLCTSDHSLPSSVVGVTCPPTSVWFVHKPHPIGSATTDNGGE